MDKTNSRNKVTKWLTARCCWLVILSAGGPSRHKAFTKPKEKQIYGLNWTVGLAIQSSTTRLGERSVNILQENQAEKKDLRVKHLTAVVAETHRAPVHLLSANYLPGPRQLYAPGWGVWTEVCHTRAQAVIVLFWPLYILWWTLSFFLFFFPVARCIHYIWTTAATAKPETSTAWARCQKQPFPFFIPSVTKGNNVRCCRFAFLKTSIIYTL